MSVYGSGRVPGGLLKGSDYLVPTTGTLPVLREMSILTPLPSVSWFAAGNDISCERAWKDTRSVSALEDERRPILFSIYR